MTMSDAVVRFDRLTRWFGERAALSDFTLDVPRGSVYALLGRNGAGKTTALRCLLGLMRPTRGRAEVLGMDAATLPPAARARIGFVAEGQTLVPWMKVRMLGEFQGATMPGFDAAVFSAHLDRLGIDASQRVKNLSRGQRAQVALALALAPSPELVILDDPAMGLDPVVRREFLEVMIDLVHAEGRTVLFTSHVLADVERVADHVAILHQGVLRVSGAVDDVKSRIVRVHAHFDGDAPAAPELAGVLKSSARGRALSLTVCDGPEAVSEWARTHGAVKLDVERLTLEDLFIDYTTSPVTGGGAAA